jgi:hypothetical protein
MDLLMLAGPDLRRPLPAPALAARGLQAGCLSRQTGSPSRPQGARRGWSPVLVVVALLVTAFALAPETPQDQAAICQRHNGPAACRVW